jgi:hypothetical protein
MPLPAGKMCEWVREKFVRYAMRWVDGKDNLCFWNCLALKKMKNDEMGENGRTKDNSIVHRAKEIYFNFYGKPYDKTYSEFNLDELESVWDHFRKNIYIYVERKLTLTIGSKYDNSLHVAYVSNGEEAHFLYVTDPEKLTNCKICPHCNSEWFDMRNNHWLKNMEKHVEKCVGGKKRKLD